MPPRLHRTGPGRPVRVAVLLCLAALSACDAATTTEAGATPRSASSQTEAFLSWYWARPLSPQGKAPATLRSHETSLQPESCGACHAEQLIDWRRSLHSRAMGPGVLGQLVNMAPHATQEHQECIRCHAPLGEQAESLAAALAGRTETKIAAPTGGRPLHEQGLVCAACHVRDYKWYGPPRRDGSQLSGDTSQFPHTGWTGSAAFEDSRFCAACHQFDKDGYALNGKLLANTYEEWKASRHAREGRSCQACHMPERRHLWRGIHDPETTRRGIAVGAVPPRVDAAGEVTAALRLTNAGTGHYFPTYVTPRIVVTMRQETASGKTLKGTMQQHVIAREVTLDLSEELFDTRIAPDEERVIEYRLGAHPRATHLAVEIRVEPDAFYTNFYRSLLKDGVAGPGRALIANALEHSLASHYILHADRQPLPEASAEPKRRSAP